MVGDVADLDPWIAEATRVLAPGGHLVYSDFHPSWATQQWRRTFRTADGRQFELNYFSHTIDDHLERLERASLEIRAIREPRIAGRATPVVAVFHATKYAPPTLRRDAATAHTVDRSFDSTPSVVPESIPLRAAAGRTTER
jgi:hypothetical protein